MTEDYQHPDHDLDFNDDEHAEHLPASVVFSYLANSLHLREQRNPAARLGLARKLGLLIDIQFDRHVHFLGSDGQFDSWRTATNTGLVSAADAEDSDLIDLPNAQMLVGGPDSIAGRLLPVLYLSQGEVLNKTFELAESER